jgi:hypothetical protein
VTIEPRVFSPSSHQLQNWVASAFEPQLCRRPWPSSIEQVGRHLYSKLGKPKNPRAALPFQPGSPRILMELRTMAGRMSINWLLNEDEDPELRPNQLPPIVEVQDDRRTQYQEAQDAYAHSRTNTSTASAMLYRVNQQQHQPPQSNLALRQHRASSVSRAGSMPRSTHPRAPRPKYSVEEDHFIWYQRIDLEKDWKEVSQAFNEYFQDRHRDGESGLQCRFYRILDSAGIPNIRSLKSSNDKERIDRFGLVEQTRYRYSWMLPRHRVA